MVRAAEDPRDCSTGEDTVELDEDVLEMVRRQLDRDPPPSTNALYGRAVQLNREIYDLSLRQFHAKYPLRVKREKARKEREESAGASPDAASGSGAAGPVDAATRERVRRVFMRFAREVAEAERPEMMVGVVERIPDRVDEIARIVRARPSGR